MASVEPSYIWLRNNVSPRVNDYVVHIRRVGRDTVVWMHETGEANVNNIHAYMQERLNHHERHYQSIQPTPKYYKTRIHSVRIISHFWTREILALCEEDIINPTRHGKRKIVLGGLKICKLEILRIKKVFRERGMNNPDRRREL